jgi:ubiquinone/menaquinone biosynthesis C-methylase UbiE
MTIRNMALASAAMLVCGGAVLAVTPLGRDLAFHLMPLGWTGEADRLAAALQIGAGTAVADIGAGTGALIIELARRTGADGNAYASERTAEQRAAIAARATAAGVHVAVIEAGESSTGLSEACCDAIIMRMVMHHIADRGALARDVRRAVRPGGLVGIIDFAPGALPHLAGGHGIPPNHVVEEFVAAGFEVATKNDRWGGRNYLIVFRPR